MKIILVRIDGEQEKPFVLETPDNPRIEPEFLIGRAPDCNLCIPEDRVSRHHCGVIVDPQDLSVRVRDMGSRNGTFVNGQRVLGDCPLHNGDQLTVGYVPFEFRLPDSPSIWNRAAARSLAARLGPRRQFTFCGPGHREEHTPSPGDV